MDYRLETLEVYQMARRKTFNDENAETLLHKADFLLLKLNAYIKFVAASPNHNSNSKPT